MSYVYEVINEGPELLISHPLNQNEANDHFFFESEDLKIDCTKNQTTKTTQTSTIPKGHCLA